MTPEEQYQVAAQATRDGILSASWTIFNWAGALLALYCVGQWLGC